MKIYLVTKHPERSALGFCDDLSKQTARTVEGCSGVMRVTKHLYPSMFGASFDYAHRNALRSGCAFAVGLLQEGT